MGWVPEKIWSGEVFILGGGPSLAKVAIDRLRTGQIIAVNNAFLVAPKAPFLFFADDTWFHWNEEELENYSGVKVTTAPALKGRQDLHVMELGKRSGGYDHRKDCISRGHNSGHGAISLAYKLGAEKIVLFGFDMHAKNGHNFHHDHEREVPDTIYESHFIYKFKPLGEELQERGTVIENATPGSALPFFPLTEPEAYYA